MVTIDDSTSPIKGHFRVTNEVQDDEFALYTISAVSNESGYHTVTCGYVAGYGYFADEDNILLSSADDKMIECSLKSFHLDGDLHNNPVIQDGDVVHVPYNHEYKEEVELSITHNQSLVFVTGFVVKPMGHRFIPGYTINDYIAMSGGVNDFGSLKKLSIYRHDKLLSLDSMNILQPGDQIDIPANMRYRMLGNISILQTVTAMMTLYLTYQAAVH